MEKLKRLIKIKAAKEAQSRVSVSSKSSTSSGQSMGSNNSSNGSLYSEDNRKAMSAVDSSITEGEPRTNVIEHDRYGIKAHRGNGSLCFYVKAPDAATEAEGPVVHTAAVLGSSHRAET